MQVYRCIVNTVKGVYEKDFPVVIQANPNGIQNSPPVETRSVPYGITGTYHPIIKNVTDIHSNFMTILNINF